MLLALCASRAEALSPPARWFVQIGTSGDADTFNAGLAWEAALDWQVLRDAQASVHADVTLGHWHARDSTGPSNANNTELTSTAALRLTLEQSPGLFGEVGVGVGFVKPLYHPNDKQFSTVFNFVEHVGFGLRPWGVQGAEISLRCQHFSNAKIKRPNPGENFVQLRWSMAI